MKVLPTPNALRRFVGWVVVMLRGPRLDLPGLLQHVTARGIECEAIFLDQEARSVFCTSVRFARPD